MRDKEQIHDTPGNAAAYEVVRAQRSSERLRICLIVSSLRGGGTERVCVTLANGLAALGHAVQLVTLNLHRTQYESALNADVELINLDKKTVRHGVFALWRYLTRSKPSVVLAFNHQLAITCVLARKLGLFEGAVVGRTGNTLSQRVALTRGVWQRRVVPGITKRLYKLCDRIVAQSEGMARDLIESFNLTRTQIVTIGNPVSIEGNADDTGADTRNAMIKRTVLFVGRLEEAKDPLFLIRSLAESLRMMPDVQLKIAGVGSLENALRDAVRIHGIASSVMFLGFQRDLAFLYREAAVTVLCSRVEGMPNCLLESLSFGTPVVALDCPHGPAEVIVDGENGYLVRERTESAFAAAVSRALSRDWDKYRLRESVSRFSVPGVVTAYEELLAAVARS